MGRGGMGCFGMGCGGMGCGGRGYAWASRVQDQQSRRGPAHFWTSDVGQATITCVISALPVLLCLSSVQIVVIVCKVFPRPISEGNQAARR